MSKKEYIENKLNYLTPFKQCVIQQFPFIEEDFDAVTNYQLLCKVVEYLNKVIANENEVTKDVSYLINWFNNLDVQDEIDNKLDEMAKDGTLEKIIAPYIDKNFIRCYSNVEEMKKDNLQPFQKVKTLGYYYVNDGGGAEYYITNSKNNNNYYETLENGNFAELIINNYVNIKQLGAKNSNDNSNDIKNYLELAYSLSNEIIIPEGNYFLSEFSPNSYGFQYKNIKGNGNPKIYTTKGFVFFGKDNGVYSDRVNEVRINNINFYGSGRSNNNRIGKGITFKWFGQCFINNCSFNYFDIGVDLINGSELVIENSIFLGNNTSLHCVRDNSQSYTDLDAIVVNNSFLSNSLNCVVLESVRGVSFNNCVIISSSNTENEKGVIIKNTYFPSDNVNFINCEFENNKNELPSIQSGFNSDSGKGCQTLNIENCKFTMYANNAIDILNGRTINIYNSVFTLIYPKIIYLRNTVPNDTKLNLNGNYYSLPQYIKDERSEFVGNYIPKNYKRLNFFPDMSRSIYEFTPSVNPKYSNDNTVLFTEKGFIQFKISNNNYNTNDGLIVLVKGLNITNISYLKNGIETNVGGFTIQNLSNGESVKMIFINEKNISHLRINFNGNAIISRVEIYGEKSNALPVSPNTTIDNVNFIGKPERGDTFVFSNNSNPLLIGTWNGNSYVGQ